MAPYVEVRELQWSIQSNATQTKIESFFCEKWLPILPISCSFCLLFLNIGYNLYYKLSTSEQRPPVNYDQRPPKYGPKCNKNLSTTTIFAKFGNFFLQIWHIFTSKFFLHLQIFFLNSNVSHMFDMNILNSCDITD